MTTTAAPKIAGGWTWASPGDVAADEKYSLGIGPFGSNLKVSDYRVSGVPLVFVRNIRSGDFEGLDGKFVSADKAEALLPHHVHPGDVLITKMGDPPGDACLYPASRPVGVITADCIRWRVHPAFPSAMYFVYAIRCPGVQAQIAGITKGVAQRKVSLSRFRGIRIPVAPAPEQARIVQALDTQFTRLESAEAYLERAQRNLEAYRASVLKAAVEGRLVPAETEKGRDYDPGSVLLERVLKERRRRWEEAELAKMAAKGQEPKNDNWRSKYKEPAAPDVSSMPGLPKDWTYGSLEAITDPIRLICYGILMPKAHVPDGVLYVKVRDMRAGYLDWKSLPRTTPEIAAKYPRSVLKAGDLLIAIRGTYGRVVDVPPELEGGNITQDSARLDLLPGLSRRYLKYALLGPLAQSHFGKVARGVAVKGVNISDLRATPIPIPPTLQQCRIADEVEHLLSIANAQTAAAGRSLTRCRSLRRTILQWAFAGRLADEDEADEPAEVLLERLKDRAAAVGANRKTKRSKTKSNKARTR